MIFWTKEETIYHFYSSLGSGDVNAMISCYHPEVVFEDPVFGELRGDRVSNMWRMLLNNAETPPTIKVEGMQLLRGTVGCIWTAKYTYGKNKRTIHNVVESHFVFKGDLIIDHRDKFDLYIWIKQAAGMAGFLFGWTKPYHKALRKKNQSLLR